MDSARVTASRALAKCASKVFCPPSVENAANQEIRLRDAGPRQSEPGVQLHRLLVGSQSFARAFFRVAVFIKAALQIQLMRLDIFRPAFFRRLHFGLNFLFIRWSSGATGQLTAHLRHDRLRQFALDREHVF